MSDGIKSLGRTRPSISDEDWDKARPVITEKFKTDSLSNVMRFMESEHGFYASKRQYVYRLGIWGAVKYKKSHQSSGLDHPNNHPGGPSKAADDEAEPASPPTPRPVDPDTSTSCPPPATSHQTQPTPPHSNRPPIVTSHPSVVSRHIQISSRTRTPSPLLSSATSHIVSPSVSAVGGVTGKRPRDESPDFETTGNYDADSSASTSGAAGKRFRETPGLYTAGNLSCSCPFRKRNPSRFNVRDYQSCAVQSFPDIPQLKRHIKNFHKILGARGVMCIRCREFFPTADELRAHMLLPVEELCEPVVSIPPRNPEDGITPEMEDVLNGRKMGLKIASWHDLWRLLFPEDSTIPEADFEPPIEHFELQRFIEDEFPRRMAAELIAGHGMSVSDGALERELRTMLWTVLDLFQRGRDKPSHA